MAETLYKSIKHPTIEEYMNVGEYAEIFRLPVSEESDLSGKTIKKIQADHGVDIDIDDDGTVTISSVDAAGAERALEIVKAMTEEARVGKIYSGRVTSVKDFGAFVEILPGQDGLCHISELDDSYVAQVSDVCRVGDSMQVKVIAVDDQGRIKLSRKAAMRETSSSS